MSPIHRIAARPSGFLNGAGRTRKRVNKLLITKKAVRVRSSAPYVCLQDYGETRNFGLYRISGFFSILKQERLFPKV